MEQPDLLIQMKKEKEGGGMVLSLIRPDGSMTWEHFKAGLPTHDLSHFAVETTLGAGYGFFGMVAQGWNFDDFEDRERRQTLPPDSFYIERIAGLFWTEFHNNDVFPPETFNVEGAGETVQPLHERLTPDAANTIRRLIRDLTSKWVDLPERDVLELKFSLPDVLPPYAGLVSAPHFRQKTR